MNIENFIRQSNAIEGVYSDEAFETSMGAWEYLEDQEDITHNIIKETHENIMGDRMKNSGEYREVQVYIGDDVPPAPDKIPYLMDEILSNKPDTSTEALLWHIDFEYIHPFEDGNGRTGRMLYLWQCMDMGETPLVFTEDNRNGYYNLFDNRGDFHNIDSIRDE